jgi:hypothetical protein
MRRRFCALALWVCACAPAMAEEPVVFEDFTLRALVEETLWVSSPTPSDMLGLTGLSGWGRDITSLVGLEHAVNMYSLGLGDNRYIRDISPLAGMTEIVYLTLSQNRIEDISPLAGMIHLKELDIHHNQICDISPLAGLTNLRWLAIRENPIRDISALAGLTRLETLKLSYTEISDISPLAEMKCLRNLDMRECPLDRSAYATHIPQIVANNPGLTIYYSPVRSYSVAIEPSAGGVVTQPGQGTFRYERGTPILLAAEARPGYMFLSWQGTFNGTENPALLSIEEDHVIGANFVNRSSTLFVDATSSSGAKPGDTSVSSQWGDGTPERPFKTIQEAIDAAGDGMTVCVRPGTYRENIRLMGRNLHLVGTYADDPDRSSFPVIEGVESGPVVSFTQGERPDCTLMGFVITRGRGDQAGAVYCQGSSPTIANCLIVGNRATAPGGAAVYCHGSQAAFVNCTIADNLAGEDGAAIRLVGSSVVITHSIVRGNDPAQILATGTGKAVVTYSNIEGGWPGLRVQDVSALFAEPGRWVDPDDPNALADPDGAETLWIEGDYHLKSRFGRRSNDSSAWHMDSVASPCIDAGDPAGPVGPEPSPNGGIINLGAYGGTVQASKSMPVTPIWGSPAPR